MSRCLAAAPAPRPRAGHSHTRHQRRHGPETRRPAAAPPTRTRTREGGHITTTDTVVCAGCGLPVAPRRRRGDRAAAGAAARASVVVKVATPSRRRAGAARRPKTLSDPRQHEEASGRGGVRRPRGGDGRPGPAAPRGPIPTAGGARSGGGGGSPGRHPRPRAGALPIGWQQCRAQRGAPAAPARGRPARTLPPRGSASAAPCAGAVSTCGAVVGGDPPSSPLSDRWGGGPAATEKRRCLQLGGPGHRHQPPSMPRPLASLLVAAHPRVALSVGDTTLHGCVPGEGVVRHGSRRAPPGWGPSAARRCRLRGRGPTRRAEPPRVSASTGGLTSLSASPWPRPPHAGHWQHQPPASRCTRRGQRREGNRRGGLRHRMGVGGRRWRRPYEVDRAVARGRREQSGGSAVSVPAAASSSLFRPGGMGGGGVAPCTGRRVK